MPVADATPGPGTRSHNQPKGTIMTMNKDQVQGLKKKVSGKINAVAGKLVGNKELEAKGKTAMKVGKAQEKFGDAKAAGKKTAY